jgi:hypothetical protein
MCSEPLEKELAYFERERERLVAEAEGKYALIHGEELLGTYESEEDAITEGYRRCGNVAFLVMEILRVQTPVELVSNLLAI